MSKNYVFRSGKELLEVCASEELPIWEVMLRYEIQISGKERDEIWGKLQNRLKVIFDGIDAAIANPELSPSKMVGTNTPVLAKVIAEFKEHEKSLLLNESAIRAMLGAVATGEHNARMGVILAFPTAGAAGVLPGVIYGAKHKLGLDEDQMVQMMLTASAIGVIIANTATLSGAAGGCQAEVGSATAMAAAALTEVRGASPEMSIQASALALKNMIGLACDPIGGLVEVPCIKRNGIGAVFSMAAADMAFMGISSFVPFDEVVRAMREVGDMMSPRIKETALGGLATTPTGQEVAKRMGLLQIGNNPCTN
jgi:L-serine dehydratase